MKIKKVSFIGLGVMGYPMAGHLINNNLEVTVFNRTESKSKQWVEEFKGKNVCLIFIKKRWILVEKN